MPEFNPQVNAKISKLPEKSRTMMLEAFKDPVKFCYYFLKDNKGNPFKLEWYQRDIINCPKRFILVNSGRQIGKTELLVKRAIYHAFTTPKHLRLIISRSQRQASYVLQRIRNDIEESPILCKSIVRASRTQITLDNKAEILSLPPSPPTIRGYSPHDVDIDEAAHFADDEIYYEVLRPMVIRTAGKITMTSTPYGRIGFFYNMYNLWQKDDDAKVFNLPAIYNGKAICPAITLKELKREQNTMSPEAFRQEYLAEFLEEGVLYFDHKLVKDSTEFYELDDRGRPNYEYYMGIDWGKAKSHTVVTIIKKNQKGDLKIAFLKDFIHKPYNEVISNVKYMLELFDIKKCLADRGAGEAQIDQLKDYGLRIEGFAFTQRSKVDLFSYLRESMRNNVLKIPEISELKKQLLLFSTEKSEKGNKLLLHAPKGAHDDYVDSLALAVFCTKKRTIKHFARGVRRIIG